MHVCLLLLRILNSQNQAGPVALIATATFATESFDLTSSWCLWFWRPFGYEAFLMQLGYQQIKHLRRLPLINSI